MVSSFELPAPGLHLKRTLSCGQAFRWTWAGRWARGVVGRTVLWLEPMPGHLRVHPEGEPLGPEAVRAYLFGGGPVRAAERRLCSDPVLRQILPLTRGISLLAQHPWEALCSFLISQNNNIPKIRLSIERLCRALGERIPARGEAFTFPSPERIAEAPPRILRDAALGYRAPYLRATARLVADRLVDLEALRRASLEEARTALLALPGVGEKVAECVLLFGLGHREAFPVDVWVRRAVLELYFRGRARTPREIRTWARERFGPLAGLAQQHLYHFARTSWGFGRDRRGEAV
ncbi:MAG: DNA-3-methyladenine glycosylase 2 family protein [Armatimonadota bacterium]|nr:DNA-3-methyladenine glycosylase 2 family protein [Armatimonadota bacterium]MDR7444922.1 DNA-3-methyladenine glycosylase 2 family protein [Armatimonadota bacterium]MDR7569141.1 DNA-3-methyladenine glycosylase 2 family protein [Armatimonadota bacterium]